MAFSITVGGMTFTEANFAGFAYADEATGLPKALEKIVEHVANAFRGTATDSLTVGTGAKSLNVMNASGQIPAFAVGMPVRIARTADPAGVWMQGEITAWDGVTGAASVSIDASKGSGTHGDWTVTVGGHLTVASGVPPLAVGQGGTGADSEAGARGNLGLVVGADVQAYDADLAAIAALNSAADQLPYATGTGAWAMTGLTAAARSILDDATTDDILDTLGIPYETGTWTPTLYSNGNPANEPTYSYREANHLKIGDLVVARFWITLGSVGALTNDYLRIGGLPFAGMNVAFASVPWFNDEMKVNRNGTESADALDIKLYVSGAFAQFHVEGKQPWNTSYYRSGVLKRDDIINGYSPNPALGATLVYLTD